VLGGEADNAEPVEKWEDVSREDLVDKHPEKRDPEEAHALLVVLSVVVQTWPIVSPLRLYVQMRKTNSGTPRQWAGSAN
jgi:hypothetical protein